ncbi:type III-A CRISPR-associated RAMP protein Csm4 [Candidatus Bipolaricaulota bacterium]|nr:type III-A CRISPR-associated RAMP protein Csm4 [Candidatus Bipolaricaulota bacterium]
MKVAIYKLTFPHGVHVGAYGIGTEGVRLTIPADTLFSALLSAWVSLGRDPDDWVSHFPRKPHDGELQDADPPFLLTSAFPYRGDVILFPKPQDPEKGPHREELHKTWKRVSFVSEKILRELVSGGDMSDLLRDEENLAQSKAVLLHPDDDIKAENGRFWTEHKIPRVTLDRVSSASNLFHVERMDFAKGAGLWFGVIWRDPDRPCGNLAFEEAFDIALNALSHSGIGGDRTVGYGTFERDKKEGTWPDPEPGKSALLLSRYNPSPDELPDVLRKAKGYALEEVRGWTSSPHGQFRRRSIVMLKEGSVLVPEREIHGHVVDIGPIHIETKEALLPHPVWRYGLAALWSLGGAG